MMAESQFGLVPPDIYATLDIGLDIDVIDREKISQHFKPPKLLDLYCGAGGAATGYYQAGFDVVGVDNKPQPRYPFEFVQADAFDFLAEHGKEFDAIHASPPCQAYSRMQYTNRMKGDYPRLIAPSRNELARTGGAWVIENVPGAPLKNPIVLCGLMFGLRVLRHRLFESSILLFAPPHVKHPRQKKVRGKTPPGYLDTLAYIGFTTGCNMKAFRDAMKCDWMTPNEAREAIPPAYTEWIGRQLLAVLKRSK